MGQARNWTPEEEDFLRENWGTVSYEGLSKHLGRTVGAVKQRASHLGLGPYLESGDYVSFQQLMLALGYGCSSSKYTTKSWGKDRGLPIHSKRRGNSVTRVVYLEEFWRWAKKNRSFIDFSKMEPYALGAEPAWLKEQRRKDHEACAIQRKDPWTDAEDSRLKMLLAQRKYTWAELSKMLHRSCGAIDRRIRDMGLQDRPIRIPCGGRAGTWTPDMFNILADGIRSGDSYQAIGEALGISEKAVRGKVYHDYLTESADRVRAMMGDGPWGTGKPVPTVRQGRHLSTTRAAIEKDLSILDALLRKRMNDLGYDPYFQRFMCQHWDDIKGCTAGGTDCDSCADFLRIRPQYCSRCGATFFERAENRFCARCRTARKKKAQRHWCLEQRRRVG